MPRHSSSLRRTGAAAVALGTAVGTLLLVTAPPASAAPFAAQYNAATSFSTSGGGCSVSDPGSSTGAIPFSAGAPASFNKSGVSVATGAAPGDATGLTSSVVGSASVAEAAGGGVTDIKVSADLDASAQRNLGPGSACSSSAAAQLSIAGTFSVAGTSVLDLDVRTSGSGFFQYTLQIVRALPSLTAVAEINYSSFGRAQRAVVVEPGDYQIQLVAGSAAAGSNTAGQPGPSADVRLDVHGAFRTLGAADGAAKGTGTKYLTFSDGQDCTSHSVTGDFTKKAGKKAKKGKKPVINKATFYVNGAKVRTVKKPNKNTLVTLGDLPADDLVEVEAVLKVRGKGPVNIRRSYLPCA